MKRIFIWIWGLCLANGLFAQITINDPHAQVRALEGTFIAIRISGGVDLYIAQSNEQALAVSASSEELLSKINTVIRGEVLEISTVGSYLRNPKFRVYVACSNLTKIIATGASDVHVQGSIKVPVLKLKLEGASDFKGSVEVDHLELDQSGASDITISGKARNAKINCSGASDCKGYDLSVDTLELDVSGASNVRITVRQEMNVKASGASDVHYRGQAVIKDFQITGASSLKKG